MSRRRGVPIGSAWSWSDGRGTVRTGGSARVRVTAAAGAGCGRRARGGVVFRLEDGRGAPPGPKPKSTARGTLPAAAAERRRVRVEMRSEKNVVVWGAGKPGEVETDAVGPVGSTKLVREGVGWATDFVAAGLLRSPR